MGKQYFAIQQAEREANIYIFGDIVRFAFFEGDASAHSIVQQIKDLDVDVINVHIDCYGGSVSEGWAIYNSLKNHPAKIKTYGDGFVASAALFPFMAGEERYASNLSAYFFHRVATSAEGYSDDLRAAANEIDLLTDIGVNAFTDNTDLSADDVKALMEDETWLSPSEALEKGIATAILADSAPLYAQDAKRNIMQQILHKQPPAMQVKQREPNPQKTPPPEEKKTDTTPHIMQMWGKFFTPKKEE